MDLQKAGRVKGSQFIADADFMLELKDKNRFDWTYLPDPNGLCKRNRVYWRSLPYIKN